MDIEKALQEARERVYANIDANVAAAQKEINQKYKQIKHDLRIK